MKGWLADSLRDLSLGCSVLSHKVSEGRIDDDELEGELEGIEDRIASLRLDLRVESDRIHSREAAAYVAALFAAGWINARVPFTHRSAIPEVREVEALRSPCGRWAWHLTEAYLFHIPTSARSASRPYPKPFALARLGKEIGPPRDGEIEVHREAFVAALSDQWEFPDSKEVAAHG